MPLRTAKKRKGAVLLNSPGGFMVGVWVLDIEQIAEFCKGFVAKQKNF